MKKLLKKLPDYYLTFCVYALIGWLYEVIWLWFVVPPYKFVNRGVLLGPFLPIYGFGILILLFMLDKFMKKKHKISFQNYLALIYSFLSHLSRKFFYFYRKLLVLVKIKLFWQWKNIENEFTFLHITAFIHVQSDAGKCFDPLLSYGG